jgi:hypothetical protein
MLGDDLFHPDKSVYQLFIGVLWDVVCVLCDWRSVSSPNGAGFGPLCSVAATAVDADAEEGPLRHL